MVALVFAGASGAALAWVYPEHRDIAVLAVDTLDPAHRAAFDRLWADARLGHEQRLCASGADTAQGVAPECIDWAAMSAISGDHSCSSQQMLDTVLDADWILAVADVAAQLKLDLSHISEAPAAKPEQERIKPIEDIRRQLDNEAIRAERINALRVSDVRLQRADPEYATRAGSNNAHFLLARPTADFTPQQYLEATLKPGSEINAIGVFGWFHLSALQKATRLAHETLSAEQRSQLVRAMLADEAFALHFLEDALPPAMWPAAGATSPHARARTTSTTSTGLRRAPGNRTRRPSCSWAMPTCGPRTRAAQATPCASRSSSCSTPSEGRGARESIAVTCRQRRPRPTPSTSARTTSWSARPPGLQASAEAIQLGVDIVRPTPVPGLGEGLGSLPRFQAEVGPFIGVAGSLELRYIEDGFTGLEDGSGMIGGADVSVRVGYGLEGVLGEAGDGLVFLALGYHGDTPSSNKFSTAPIAQQAGSLAAAIPGRTAWTMRLRMPFYLVPGDLLLLSPLYFVSPDGYESMAVTAANGGLLRWQLGWATRFGRYQFVLGREIGVTFYGEQSDDTLFAPRRSAGPAADPVLQVDVLRPADPRIPALSRLRHDADLRGDRAAFCGP